MHPFPSPEQIQILDLLGLNGVALRKCSELLERSSRVSTRMPFTQFYVSIRCTFPSLGCSKFNDDELLDESSDPLVITLVFDCHEHIQQQCRLCVDGPTDRRISHELHHHTKTAYVQEIITLSSECPTEY